MEIRGEEVLLPVSAVSAFPRPHWLQGRVLGSLSEPVYRSHNLRVAYQDACKICAHEQELAGLDILCDGAQYYEWEAPGFQLEPIFHFIPENLGGFVPYGPPGDGAKYRPFYQAVVKSKITWERPIFESVVMTMQDATTKPFKVAFLGPAQQSVIVKDEFYGDPIAVATDLAIAMNKELKYLVSMGLEAVQLIDVLAPYTQDRWQLDMQDIMFDGVDAIKFWHICYGSVDGQRDVFDGKAAEMMPLFKESPVDVIHLEMASKGYDELAAFSDFPTDKVLGVGVVDVKSLQVETPEQIEARIRRALEVVPADRLLVAPDCGLGYFSRTVAYAKLRAMGQAAATVRASL
jgi:5-methyltetrahydropteroyltriglutamate--homocysteine methyltransferase